MPRLLHVTPQSTFDVAMCKSSDEKAIPLDGGGIASHVASTNSPVNCCDVTKVSVHVRRHSVRVCSGVRVEIFDRLISVTRLRTVNLMLCNRSVVFDAVRIGVVSCLRFFHLVLILFIHCSFTGAI